MSPDHGTGRGEQPSTPCCLIDAPQVPHRLHCDLSWLDRVGKKLSLKKTWKFIAILLLCLDSTVDFSYCDNAVGFHNWALLAWNSTLTGMMSLQPGCMVRIMCGQLVNSCLHLGFFPPSLPTYPSSHPTYPLPCIARLKLMHTFEKIV